MTGNEINELEALEAVKKHIIEINLCENSFSRFRMDVKFWFLENKASTMPICVFEKLKQKYLKD